jgi:hypothetical protein
MYIRPKTAQIAEVIIYPAKLSLVLKARKTNNMLGPKNIINPIGASICFSLFKIIFLYRHAPINHTL